MDTLNILRENALFKTLDEAELDAVAKCVEERRYEANQTVILEGAPGDALYLVRTGRVRVEKEGRIVSAKGETRPA